MRCGLNGWQVNPSVITDDVGGASSLSHIAKENPQRALKLLKNRYLILLTRATKSIHLYVEDRQTLEHIVKLLRGKGNLH